MGHMNTTEMSHFEDALLQQAQLLTQELALRQWLIACIPPIPIDGGPASTAELCTAIAPSDRMLLHSLGELGDAGAAVSQYFAVGLQQYCALAQSLSVLQPETHPLRILDFACGFGRALRFLKFTAPDHTLHASEIQPDALDFIRDSLGVEILLSAANPVDFFPSGKYDFIWVVSLFSHLPDTPFSGWLERLAGLLDDDGLLCFSVRGASQLAANKELPVDGILYERASEISPLDADIYGTTYVSDACVARRIRSVCGDVRFACVKRALANEREPYFIARNPGIDQDALVSGWRHFWIVAMPRRTSAGVWILFYLTHDNHAAWKCARQRHARDRYYIVGVCEVL